MNHSSRSGYRRQLLAGGLLLMLIVAAAILSPWIAPRNPLLPDLNHRLVAPCVEYPLGTDQLGRCVLSRILYGARISLGGALSASLLAMLIGSGMGIAAALDSRWLRTMVTALIDMALALPGLILALVIAGLIGAAMKSLVIGLVMAGWPWWARWVRGMALSAWEKEFVMAGRVAGIRGGRLITHYILPQLAEPMLTAATLKTGWIILAFAGLSYLGLGPPPPQPEWGAMMREANIYMTSAPWLMLAPGTAVTLTVLALNLMGEGMKPGEAD